MRVTSETIYEHDEHGEVLIIDVHHVFNEYDLKSGSGDLHSRVVRYTPNWDDYGPMPGSIQMTSTDDFREQLGDRVETFEPLQPQAETDK
ncbi:hypothetical protein BV210_11590 [Halorientalis sp. IM1011]|uniref:hypothetical protein n=1 Tax=Halorientalis sp. IM1011 TaxID=1932360 RepID=UPI00097CD5E0|nr:hypothetical protein [Halorientalis sp. IM1011]AQL43295.1 hypothetical protein BV210_11590 [Halorientalis sp. IM1011]